MEAAFSTGGASSVNYGGFGIKHPSDAPNKELRDYWAVGAQAQVGIIAVNLKIHPLQLADFLATIVFLDPLYDNVGSTRSIHFDEDEEEAVKRVARGKAEE